MDERIIPNGTLVQIMKPAGNTRNWSDEQTRVGWSPDMNRYVGQSFVVLNYDQRHKWYELDGACDYVWHGNWLIMLSNNGEPYGNEKRTDCFWCNGSLKTTKEKFNEGFITFKYCPKCGR